MFNVSTCSPSAFGALMVIGFIALLLILIGQGFASSIPLVLRLVFFGLGILGMVKMVEVRRQQQR